MSDRHPRPVDPRGLAFPEWDGVISPRESFYELMTSMGAVYVVTGTGTFAQEVRRWEARYLHQLDEKARRLYDIRKQSWLNEGIL